VIELLGDVSRVDCDNTPEAQDLPVGLYEIVCEGNGSDLPPDEREGLRFIHQRREEAQIINDKLVRGPRYLIGDVEFNEHDLVIIDCPRAFGGICVLSELPEQSNIPYLYVTDFRPLGLVNLNGLMIQTVEYLKAQEPDFEIQGETNQDVLAAQMLIRQSRAFFDDPEAENRVASQIVEGMKAVIEAAAAFLGAVLFH
jgi:hypothetical protein